MLTTENFARTQWCPLSRVASPVDASSFNRLGVAESGATRVPVGSCCVASACMAWRWKDAAEPPYMPRKVIPHPSYVEDKRTPDRPDNVPEGWEFLWYYAEAEAGDVWVEPEAERKAREDKARVEWAEHGRRGYCGQFGEPRHG